MSIITLTTDFGSSDSYVGELKGVLLSRCPSARLVDIAHGLRPGDIAGGAWVLARIWDRYPMDAVHLAVVDPTVGSARRSLAARAGDRWFVGPDNGLLSRVQKRHAVSVAVQITPAYAEPGQISDTFHGRDVFAPAAAHLACGGSPEALGSQVDAAELTRLPISEPERRPGEIAGSVVHVDRFGTLVTDIPVDWLPPEPEAEVGSKRVAGLARSFAEVRPGMPLLIRGSAGTLEIAARDESAARLLGVETGERVTVRSVA